MVKMTSLRPLYINGVSATSFETTEQHAKQLEKAGKATRDELGEDTSGGGDGDDTVPGGDSNALLSDAVGPTIDQVRAAPENRDNFEREPIRHTPKKKK